MNKKLAISAVALILSLNVAGCSQKESVRTLTIYNWQDYIYEGDDENPGVVEQFKTYYYEKYNETIEVEYYTFETNENMLNVLKTGKSNYDLVCPSDYTIQKMIMEDMVQPLDKTKLNYYYEYASPYIQNIFEKSTAITKDKKEVSWADYAIPYMWGTMGFMYNPEMFDNVTKFEEDITSWNILWNENYKGRGTLKDSVRDTYCAGILKVYEDELNDLATKYASKEITGEQYTEKVTEIMNRTDKETLDKVEKALKEAKNNVYGFEVDSGKSDIVTGKIDMNFCWSGDAVYSMDCAEEESGIYLNYYVPKEGSNVWFDGWVIPKDAEEVDLAHEFLNFICNPDIAYQNMEEIGYTSSIAGQAIFDLVNEWYAPSLSSDFSEDEWNELSLEEQEEILANDLIFATEESLNEALENEEIYALDLSYFFGDTIEEEATIYYFEKNRQLNAQFPDYDTIVRCGVMEDFGDANEDVINMWSRVKSNEVPVWGWIVVVVAIIIAIIYFVYSYLTKKIRMQRINLKRQTN